MRIEFIFETDEKKDSSCFIDFPCRLFDNDMVKWSVFPEEIKDKYDNSDNMIVECTAFSKDQNGIYQTAWMGLE